MCVISFILLYSYQRFPVKREFSQFYFADYLRKSEDILTVILRVYSGLSSLLMKVIMFLMNLKKNVILHSSYFYQRTGQHVVALL